MPSLSVYFDEWKPVSKPAAISWLVAYALFLFYAAINAPNFLFIDFANLAIHEAGHPLFGFFGGSDQFGFGYTLTILGGTLLELIVPLACFVFFFFKRETTAVAFCSFWFFENFLYIGTYMADARALQLPLVGSGDHDWNILFGQWGWLRYDVSIGHTTRFLGWLGMIATMAWLAFRSSRSASAASQ
ncbi:MAG: hypothetical protein JSS69_08100 [Acidobacteria bacterium]|nr:hypothetical protein [Acidobacteriota bacterium]MBS1865865.1 hypothetical protein [Acidobacteriota bacterium]